MKNVRQRSRAGFTLVEILLVVAIIGILAGVVALNTGKHADKARIRTCRVSIGTICTAIDAYQMDTGRYPNSLEGLVTSPGGLNTWDGPYIRGGTAALIDPWAQPFQYSQGGDSYLVKSPGIPGKGEPITSHAF